jgi:intein/homing endonuclease
MFTDKRLTVVDNSIRHHQQDGKAVNAKVITTAHRETAYFPNQVGATPTSIMGFGSNQYTRTLSGIVPDQQEDSLIDYYRDCYYYDSVAGATVDMISTFPFSNWTLGGVKKEIAEVFSEALARLNIRTMMPEISRDHLVDGAFIGSLVFDKAAGTFVDVLVHDRQACTVFDSPFRTVDAVITMHSCTRLRQFLDGGNQYAQHLLRNYPQKTLNAFLNGNVDLDPLKTLYLPRKGLQDRGAVSYLKRILPYYLLERTLYRGMLVEVSKRLRSTTHVQVGDDTWEPTTAELMAIRDMCQNTELDPLGAWMVTRQGVQISDVRPGGDFLRWTDIAEQLTPLKLRALGISEGFLTGDACLTGDTLVATSQGLRRVDSFGPADAERNQPYPVDVTVKSRYTNRAKAANWIYNGVREVFEVKTESGYSVKATDNHPFLVFDGIKTKYVRQDQLKVGDMLCLDTRELTRKTKLPLNIPKYDFDSRVAQNNPVGRLLYSPKEVKYPKFMNTELAYCLGILVAEGYSNFENGTVMLDNTDMGIIRKFTKYVFNQFGVKPFIRARKPGAVEVSERTGIPYKPCWTAGVTSVALVEVFRYLGFLTSKELRGDSELAASYFKTIPWSILEADGESQMAFTAGLLDGDGGVRNHRIGLKSTSMKLLAEFQVMLNAHGIYATYKRQGIEINGSFCARLIRKIKPYLVKPLEVDPNMRGSFKKHAMSIERYKKFLTKKRVGFNRHGAQYETATGEIVTVSANEIGARFIESVRLPYNNPSKAVSFKEYLAAIHERASVTFWETFQQEYVFEPIVSITPMGKERVYDLCMSSSEEPAFVANGLVVHNTFATAEAALSVFLENMAAYREFITHKMFDSKLFPLIAVVKGLYKDPAKARRSDSVRDLIFNMSNHKNLEIPTIQWHKSLEAKDGENQFEVLEKLSEKGYPIPMKMWAAAANIDIGSLISDLKEDQEIKEAIKGVTGVDPDVLAQQNQMMSGGEGDDTRMGQDYSFASATQLRKQMNPFSDVEVRTLKNLVQSRRGPSLLSREFKPQPVTKPSKSGKVQHAVYNERETIRQENNLIMRASRALQDPDNQRRMRERVIARLGKMPNILGVDLESTKRS